jgi:hypothetical protein
MKYSAKIIVLTSFVAICAFQMGCAGRDNVGSSPAPGAPQKTVKLETPPTDSTSANKDSSNQNVNRLPECLKKYQGEHFYRIDLGYRMETIKIVVGIKSISLEKTSHLTDLTVDWITDGFEFGEPKKYRSSYFSGNKIVKTYDFENKDTDFGIFEGPVIRDLNDARKVMEQSVPAKFSQRDVDLLNCAQDSISYWQTLDQ